MEEITTPTVEIFTPQETGGSSQTQDGGSDGFAKSGVISTQSLGSKANDIAQNLGQHGQWFLRSEKEYQGALKEGGFTKLRPKKETPKKMQLPSSKLLQLLATGKKYLYLLPTYRQSKKRKAVDLEIIEQKKITFEVYIIYITKLDNLLTMDDHSVDDASQINTDEDVLDWLVKKRTECIEMHTDFDTDTLDWVLYTTLKEWQGGGKNKSIHLQYLTRLKNEGVRSSVFKKLWEHYGIST